MLDLILPDFADLPASPEEDEDPFAKYLLCDEAHLEAFGFWYEMDGPKQPLTPEQACAMPATMVKDFRLLLRLTKQLKIDHST